MRSFWGWGVLSVSACALSLSAAAAWLSACAPSTAPHPSAGASSPNAGAERRVTSSLTPGPSSGVAAPSAREMTGPPPLAAEAPAVSPAAPARLLPPGITVGQVIKLRVPHDRALLVAHAPANVRLAALYLHGVCGDIDAIRSWAEVASKHATLIALLADEPCADGSRYRWTSNTQHQQRRLAAALSAVKDARGGLLDTDEALLIGYSQGALRALALRAAYPERYPRLLLGGLPAQPPNERVRGVERIALLAGSLEGKAQVQSTLKALNAADISAQLFILPQAGHGQYGPEAPRVLDESLTWLLDNHKSAE